MKIYSKLAKLQREYKAPKNNYNSHGGFNYRSLETMLENLKPMLEANDLLLVFKDTLENCADTPHIVAHAELINLKDTNESIEVTATAQEAAIQKGMQAAQISGSTSSYARKFALAALLLVDESEELDSKQGDQSDYEAEINQAKSLVDLMKIFNNMNATAKDEFQPLLSSKRKELQDGTKK